jgi:hypothetical protein
MALPDLTHALATDGQAACPSALPNETGTQSLALLRRLREEWLARAGREIEAARVLAEAQAAPDPASVIKYLQQTLNAAADADCLAAPDRLALAEQARAVARIACQRALEHVLDCGHDIVRGQAKGRLEPLLDKAAVLMQKLEQLHFDRDAQARLKAKLDILLHTNARGVSAKAKTDEAINTRPFVRDQRLFVRSVEPPVQVRLNGKLYQAGNWSLGGLLLNRVAAPPAALGSLVDLRFSVEGGPAYDDRATLARFDPARNALALQLRRFGSTMVTLRQWCETRGLLHS